MTPRNKLYATFLTAAIAGYTYFAISLYRSKSTDVSFCMIKNVTGYACPSCGTTRAIQLLLQQRWIASLEMNPFGIIVLLLMAIVPFWIITDMVLKKDSFFKSYKKTETTIRKPWIAFILIVLVFLNWIWNLYKHL
ncbi:DUF2752 domain-containing protein [Flavobacterium sp.]|uniref:DUF2752 domain-containing protein n=1 Tax=Flavobacterium sp. TaxID=239 RepID=UPI0025F654CE|nr:DUF2752 domain-containing protein [Flavobacterium sp.]